MSVRHHYVVVYMVPVFIATCVISLQHPISDEEEEEEEEEDEEEEHNCPRAKIRKPKHICVCGKHALVLPFKSCYILYFLV